MPYLLTSEEWIAACKSLRPAEIKVLYYLKTRMGRRLTMRLQAKDIALDLGLHEDTVQLSLKNLSRKKFICVLSKVDGCLTIVGDDRSIAGDDRSIAGDDRSIAGDDRSIAGDDRSIAGDDRSIAGDDRSIATQLSKPSPSEGFKPRRRSHGRLRAGTTERDLSLIPEVINVSFSGDQTAIANYRQWVEAKVRQLPRPPVFPSKLVDKWWCDYGLIEEFKREQEHHCQQSNDRQQPSYFGYFADDVPVQEPANPELTRAARELARKLAFGGS